MLGNLNEVNIKMCAPKGVTSHSRIILGASRKVQLVELSYASSSCKIEKHAKVTHIK